MSFNSKRSDVEAAKAEKAASGIHVSQLVRVLKFDSAALTVDVQPINKESIDGSYASAAAIMAVPVACLCCGDFVIRPWYKRGDVGLLIYGDNDIDAALQSDGKDVEPNTSRSHSPEDGVFVGGLALKGKTPSGLPDNALVLAAGSVYLAISPAGVTISGQLTVNGIDMGAHTHTAPGGGGSTSGPQ